MQMVAIKGVGSYVQAPCRVPRQDKSRSNKSNQLLYRYLVLGTLAVFYGMLYVSLLYSFSDVTSPESVYFRGFGGEGKFLIIKKVMQVKFAHQFEALTQEVVWSQYNHRQ